MKSTPLIYLSLLTAIPLAHGERVSTNYTLSPEILDAGGGQSSSSDYTNDLSTGGQATGISSSVNYTDRGGYTGQLFDVVSLAITATPSSVNEGETTQLEGQALLDDGTTLDANQSDIIWSLVGANNPLEQVDENGLATAGPVYESTPATVSGSLGDITGELMLTILNSNTDDFGDYAGDGLDDFWQVENFGPPPNSEAAPEENPDNDSASNEWEYLAGTNPLDSSDFFALTLLAKTGSTAQLALSQVIPNRTYSLMAGTDLENLNDEVTQFTVASEATDHLVEDTSANEAAKFYRIEISIPSDE
ncbi:MAG: hypothetical protein Q7Q71_04110 [Verrucomicrobiota bacterium JB023]|nr:hypothetical protein [Verrucomicrobiota bacterium JB023]